jgi:nucleoside-diphosphate-sugar epimerase
MEDADTDRPLSPYAASKKAAETIAYTYHYLSGIDVTVLRFFTVYGPAGRPDMSLFRFVQWIAEGRPVIVFGDGKQERDFTYVDDVARGSVAALAPAGYEIINLGSDRPVVLLELVRLVEEFTGRTAKLEYRPRHPADVTATWANITKAKRLLDWEPRTSFRDGVHEAVEWYEKNRAWARDIVTT